jgi:hypothetical protein
MRKVLLASTALVALTSVSAMAADVTISGGANFIYSNDEKHEQTSSDANLGSMSSFESEADVNIKFSATTDSGITTTFNAGFDEGNNTDDSSATISGDFGSIQIVTTSGGLDSNYVAGFDEKFDKAGEGTGGEDTNLGGVGTGESIGYKLPSIVDGLTVAIQHTNEDQSESFGYGVSYDAGIAAVGYAKIANNTETYTTKNITASVSGVALGYEVNNYEKGTTENESTLYGVSYTMDAITLAYEAGSTKDAAGSTTDDYTQMAVGYSVAPGIALHVTSSEIDNTDDTKDVEELEVQLKLSF